LRIAIDLKDAVVVDSDRRRHTKHQRREQDDGLSGP